MQHTDNHKHLSKFLSLILRHRPEVIGATLEPEGWIDVEELIKLLNDHGKQVDRVQLEEMVRTNPKQRFAISTQDDRIRASQGHSIPVDLNMTPVAPPDLLYHGTISAYLSSIEQKGLVKGSRNHVHLSHEQKTAATVGSRRGKPVILNIESGRMHDDGYLFYLSQNGVWLTDHVPPQYLRKKE